ncbi:MAG: hypothetical protein KatS3mg061_1450 [Dehalococcoidia bacterium]|nr:MAG: hypothetical protein KatS3mg061_1450 [Dehalococcoidia bacterium]
MAPLALVQARYSSSRLLGKVLAPIAGVPMLLRVVARVRQAATLTQVVVVTSDQPSDDAVVACCTAAGVPVFRGALADVLDRFYRAACQFGGDPIVRVTADCPLIDPAVIDQVVRAYQQGGVDYATNTLPPTYPDGLDVEVFSRAALARAHAEARRPSEREHVTPYLRQAPGLRRLNVAHVPDLSPRGLQWSVDTAADLAFVRAVYAHLGEGSFGLPEVLALLEREPVLHTIQPARISNEGYYRSLYREAQAERSTAPGSDVASLLIDFTRPGAATPAGETLTWLGQRLQDGFNALAAEAGLGGRVASAGPPLAARLHFRDAQGRPDAALAARFRWEAARRGIRVRDRHQLHPDHSYQTIEQALRAYAAVFHALAAQPAAPEDTGTLAAPAGRPAGQRTGKEMHP